MAKIIVFCLIAQYCVTLVINKAELMATIGLEGLEFKAPIGVYPEEKRDLNTIIVDVALDTTTLMEVKDLNDTLNYEWVYQVVEQEVMVETDLLEDTLQRVVRNIQIHHMNNLANLVALNSIQIRIKKMSPPIDGNIKSVWIEEKVQVSPEMEDFVSEAKLKSFTDLDI